MNQILATSNKSGKNNRPTDIKKIVLFFSIVIIIFGIAMIISRSNRFK